MVGSVRILAFGTGALLTALVIGFSSHSVLDMKTTHALLVVALIVGLCVGALVIPVLYYMQLSPTKVSGHLDFITQVLKALNVTGLIIAALSILTFQVPFKHGVFAANGQ